MIKIIMQTAGGGVAKVKSDWVVDCTIQCGFTVSLDRIIFSFPFTINNAPFNYYLIIEPDKDRRDAFFSKPENLQGLQERLEKSLWENIPIALREAMHVLGESAMFSAGVPIEETKAAMVERLQKRFKKEVVRQLKQKTGKAKIKESEYSKLLDREKSLSDEYRNLKREHDYQYQNYCKINHKRTHIRDDWQQVWKTEALSKHSHLPLHFVELLADGYSAKQVAHMHLASEFDVKVSALERFILPRARKAEKNKNLWFVEYV